MKNFIPVLVMLFSIHCFSQEYHTVSNVIAGSKPFEIQAKLDASTFTLKIIDINKSNADGLNYNYNVDITILSEGIAALIHKVDTSVAPNAEEKKTFEKVLAAVNAKKESLKSTLQKTTESIDGEPAQYSGALKLNTVVKLTYDDKSLTSKKQQSQLKLLYKKKEALDNQSEQFHKQLEQLEPKQEDSVALNTVESNKLISIKDSLIGINSKQKIINDSINNIIKYFHIHKAYINFFNNKASTIVLEGKVSDVKDTISANFTEITSVNNSFSVPIRYFNSGESTNSFKVDGKFFNYNYNDVFAYNADQHYNYSIANTELHISKDTLVRRVQQRQFFDFFTAVLYTDVMAFDNNNSNSLVNAQAKLLLPLNQRNTVVKNANFIWFRQLVAEANLALYNGSNDSFRTIEITQNTVDATVTNTSFSHFELLTKNNINGNLAVDFLSHEAKRYFSHISLGYEASFFRTALKTSIINSGDGETAKDDENISSLISTSHGPYLNIEIRPQTNFGADVNVSLNNLSYSGSNIINGINIKETIVDNGFEHFGAKYNIVNIKADFYWLTNPEKGKKGGIFARLGAYYHTQSYQVHPQLMVGYATNLTSFVNKFSPKEKANK